MGKVLFPDGFLWGTATSSYQIEGGWQVDGKGESIWDRFAHTPGKISDGSSGDVACDHYNRYASDVALMADLGLQAYRFSISWPRILPEGRGRVNQAGLDFYSRLVDELLDRDIAPFATLYHWDLPQQLQDRGGWPERETAVAFAEYADLVSRHLGDRVKHWITHNEPWVVAYLGYYFGEHAPGLTEFPAALQAAHHVLLSHGLAVPLIRQNAPGAEVGITLNLTPAVAASSSPADNQAAVNYDGFFNRWFLDPIFGRGYPRDMVNFYTSEAGERRNMAAGEALAAVFPGDLEHIAAPIDFLGVNYYHRTLIRAEGVDRNHIQTVYPFPESVQTEMGWEVYPPGLYNLLCRIHEDYRAPKIYITENGCSYGDGPDENGRIADVRRVRFLREHFIAAARAVTAGVPLAGYFVWSLFDNFEWAHGYKQRFGLVWVDFNTQERLPKDSAFWYRDVIRQNGFDLV